MSLAALIGWVLFAGLAGLAVGTWFGRRRSATLETEVAVLRERLRNDSELSDEREQVLNLAMERLRNAFHELAGQSLRDANENLLTLARSTLGEQQAVAAGSLKEREQAIATLLAPLTETLDKTRQTLADIESNRQREAGSLKQAIHTLTESHGLLQRETRNLVTALRRPQVRGQWGEITLRRLVELAGMTSHCDFTEQVSITTEGGVQRPDMIVHMPDGRDLVVDVKTPLDAYLTAVEAASDEERKVALQRHARLVGQRVRELSSKSYWEQFDRAPQFVVLFIPGDQFLAAALDEQPQLLDDALRQSVILATPASLVALLKVVAFGWQQVQLNANADQVRALAEDLYKRLLTYRGHAERLGRQLETAVKTYNQSIGSLDRQVLPGARKFTELGVAHEAPLEPLEPIETQVRELADRSSDETPPTSTPQ